MMRRLLGMLGNYEERKVARYEKDGLMVSTAFVTDSRQPYETAICHPRYNDGEHIIVELYNDKESAQEGHDKWVNKMTSKKLPETLRDASSAEIAKVTDVVEGKGWRKYKRQG